MKNNRVVTRDLSYSVNNKSHYNQITIIRSESTKELRKDGDEENLIVDSPILEDLNKVNPGQVSGFKKINNFKINLLNDIKRKRNVTDSYKGHDSSGFFIKNDEKNSQNLNQNETDRIKFLEQTNLKNKALRNSIHNSSRNSNKHLITNLLKS